MRLRTCLTAIVLLCSIPAVAQGKSKSWLSKTSWTFLDDGTQIRESIDDRGNYVVTSADGKHIDHGALVLKNGRVCHTSAMNKDGEVCWTVPHARIGQTVTATSANGHKLEVTRVAYVADKVPR